MAIEGGAGGSGEFQTVSVPSPALETTCQPVDAAPKGTQRGGFWIRTGAQIIDLILLGIVGYILGQVFGSRIGGGLYLLVDILYFVYFWSSTGQTIGMKTTNLRVVKEDGSGLTVTDGIVRYVGRFISFVVICLGVLWVAWDGNKQGWHDKMAHTFVVKV